MFNLFILLESLESFSLFLFFRNYFFNFLYRLDFSLFYFSKILFNLLSKSINSDRDCEVYLFEVLVNWLFIMFFSLIFSFIFFISEELETSILEIFFETFFITWVVIFFPDIFFYNLNLFSNKLHFNSFSLILLFLPYLELFSQFLKSFTLSIRLNVNFMSGHLLFSFIVILLEKLYMYVFYMFFSSLFVYFFVYFMEIFVSLLQIYVILLLTTIYLHESNI